MKAGGSSLETVKEGNAGPQSLQRSGLEVAVDAVRADAGVSSPERRSMSVGLPDVTKIRYKDVRIKTRVYCTWKYMPVDAESSNTLRNRNAAVTWKYSVAKMMKVNVTLTSREKQSWHKRSRCSFKKNQINTVKRLKNVHLHIYSSEKGVQLEIGVSRLYGDRHFTDGQNTPPKGAQPIQYNVLPKVSLL